MSSYWFGIASTFSERAASSYVQGASGENPDDWADILYQYFRKNYQGTWPPRLNPEGEEVFSADNEPIDTATKESYHVFIFRSENNEDKKLGAGRMECQDTYGIALYVKTKKESETFRYLHNILEELRRIFIRDYLSYDLAGLRLINHFHAGPLEPPNTGANQTSGHYLIVCTIDLFYNIASNFSPETEESVYAGDRFAAGQWRKEVDHR